MAGDDDAEREAVEVIPRSRLPLFRGTTNDTLSTLSWCESVDRQKSQHGWSEERTATAAIDSFRDRAAEWFRVILEEQPDATKTWALFRPLIVSRFGHTRSPAQRVSLISGLQQKNNENTESFYDTVAAAYYEVLRDSKASLADPHKNHKETGFKVAQNELLKLTYVAGLKTHIREQVEAAMVPTSTLAWIREKAAAVEVATSRKKTGYAAAIVSSGGASADSDPQGLAAEIQKLFRAEIAAMKGGAASNKSSGGQAQDPSKPRQPQQTAATKKLGPMAERGWLYCNRCCQWGLHIRAECTWSMNHIKTLPKMDQGQKPSSTPCDQQYPNI